jgi:hypothetical protein
MSSWGALKYTEIAALPQRDRGRQKIFRSSENLTATINKVNFT